MNELGRESRALLMAARHGDGIGSTDRERIRAKLRQRIGAGVALGSALSTTATVAQAARPAVMATLASWLPVSAKVLSILALAGATGFGVVGVADHLVQTPKPTREKAGLVRSEPRVGTPNASAIARAAIAIDTAPGLEAPAPMAPANTTAANIATKSRAPAPRRGSTEPPTEPPAEQYTQQADVEDGLVNQVAAIRESRAALRRGDGEAALAALDRGLPAGQAGPLEQEALFARVTALCMAGKREQARFEANQFVSRFPNSLLGSKLRTTCAYAAGPSAKVAP